MNLAGAALSSSADDTAPDSKQQQNAQGILIVDDEAPIRNILMRYLRSKEFSVDGAEGADEGLQLITAKRYAVALCDLRMKGSSGFDFLAGARKLDAGLPIVILSGAFDAEVVAQATLAGAAAFLAKPIEWATLLSAISSVWRAPDHAYVSHEPGGTLLIPGSL